MAEISEIVKRPLSFASLLRHFGEKMEPHTDLRLQSYSKDFSELTSYLKNFRFSGEPFAGYKDFADCVQKNKGKKGIKDVKAYCASIMRKVEGGELIRIRRESQLDQKLGLNEMIQWELMKDRTVIFHGYVNQDRCREAAERLEFMGRISKDPVKIILNSVGGGVYDGLLVFDTIKSLVQKGINVSCEARGLAASMGCIILQAGSERLATPHTRFLIHEVSSMTWGKTSDVEEQTEELRKVNNLMRKILAERTGKSAEEIEKIWHKKDVWKSAEEALDFGLIDEVIESGGEPIIVPEVFSGEWIACPQVYTWRLRNDFPTLYMWKTEQFKWKGETLSRIVESPVKFNTALIWDVPHEKIRQFTTEILPVNWLDIGGELFGNNGTLEFLDKKFRYLLGDSAKETEFFFFGETLRGRHLIDNAANKESRFWKPTDQSRFDEIESLSKETSGELVGFNLKFVQDHNLKGVLVEGEATHAGKLESTYKGKRKVFTEDELLQAARSLTYVPILHKMHRVGPQIGEILWSFYDKARKAVKYKGWIWNEKIAERTRNGEVFKGSVGYNFHRTAELNGLAIQDMVFTDFTVLEKGQLPGDPKAFLKVA